MSGKIKSRSAANADTLKGGVSCDERILRDCHQLYTDPDSGEFAELKVLLEAASTFYNEVKVISCSQTEGQLAG